MSAVVPLFLLAPLVLVPLGYRLLEVAAPGSRPPRVLLATVVPAAGVLVVSFWLPAGPMAAALALPWLAVTGGTALAAGIRFLEAPDRFRPGIRHATDAAVAFLAVGAAFAVTDRLGVQPFGFSAAIILLTAVHFHFAGFVLPLAGALAYRRRPRRWLELAIGAVIVGIPITALGFLGLPFANWIGAMLTATGGFAIGVATLGTARTLLPRTAAILAGIAGASLLVAMPLAAIYVTGTLVGAAWLWLDLMARLHGSLNALGFALPVMVAWTLDRHATAPSGDVAVARPAPLRRWGIGLVLGVVVGVGILVGGPLVGLIGIAAVLLLAVEPGREAPVGGLMTGFGGAWLLLFIRVEVGCGLDCGATDLTPWIAFAALMLLIGVALSIRTHRTAMAGAPP